ncbi:MAG: phage tail protein [Bryobacteraceae bacterium]
MERTWDDCNFLVEVDGVVAAGFAEVDGLEAKSETIRLRSGLAQSMDLWHWVEDTVTGQAPFRHGSVVVLDGTRQEVARFGFTNGWPSQWKPTGSCAAGLAIGELEIRHERLG